MTPEERDYEEAKRRILKAKENKSVELVLRTCLRMPGVWWWDE
jgi:hypothetical protein